MARRELSAPQLMLADSVRAARPEHPPLRLNPFRSQPPVYSPLPRAAIAAAAREAASQGSDTYARLQDLLLREYAADRVILCASGTMALQLAIRAAVDQVGATVPVALPAFTCYDVATAAVGADARIALYDIDPDTLQPDLDSLDAVLRDGAGIVVVAHLFGLPVEWEEVERLAAARGAVVIEDAAQGHGGRWKERRLGGLSTMSVLSFGRGKGWTGGGGGALLLRSGPRSFAVEAPLAAPMTRSAIMWLRVAAQSALSSPALYGLPSSIPWLGLGETRYHAPAAPESMGRFTAALLMHSRAAAECEADSRLQNGRALGGALANLHKVSPLRTTGSPGFLRFPVRITGGVASLQTRDRLARLGVMPSYPKPLGRLPSVTNRLVTRAREFVGAEALVRELVTIPTHSLVTDRDRQQMLQLLDIRKAGA